MIHETASEISTLTETKIIDWGQQDMEEVCLLVIAHLVEFYGALCIDRTREEIRYGG